jgi:hypothetical protein
MPAIYTASPTRIVSPAIVRAPPAVEIAICIEWDLQSCALFEEAPGTNPAMRIAF